MRIARSARAGFSLLELMVVVVILGTLTAVLVVNLAPRVAKAKRVAARALIKKIEDNLEYYKLDVGKYPDNLDALIHEPSGVKGWDGPYLKEESVPKDPWHNELKYSKPGANGRPYDVISFGADGAPGGQTKEDADLVGATESDDEK